MSSKLKDLIKKYGKDKINTLTKYPSILTLHEFGERGRFTNDFTTDISKEEMFATEKIDGTNVRIVCYGDEFLIGSRKCILHYSNDFYWDESMDIVKEIFNLGIATIKTDVLTVIYGELYGGKISSNSKQYGKDSHGFRVFDIATISDLSILDKPIDSISTWRESSLDSNINSTLRYGQHFLTVNELKGYKDLYDLVPSIKFDVSDMSHEEIMIALKEYIPYTNVALSDKALGNPEGVILRNSDRSKIVKIRYEDYKRTLK